MEENGCLLLMALFKISIPCLTNGYGSYFQQLFNHISSFKSQFLNLYHIFQD